MKRFLGYVEIKTKITSLFPFLMTLALLFYERRPVRWDLTALFFVSMFLFDLATTAINNYIDTKTNGAPLQFSRKAALAVIGLLLAGSTASGLWLACLTDIVVLLAGALCFLCGILYTYGPVPISRQPLGELLSGLFYGFFIPFLILYVNLPAGSLVSFSVNWQSVDLSVRLGPAARLVLFSLIPVCATAGIMLANNICDVEKDTAVRRHTLPYYLGAKSLRLFAGLYYLCYAAVVAMAAIRMLPLVSLAALLTFPAVEKNIRAFRTKQEKSSTFIVSIWNYMILMGSMTLTIFLGRFLS